MTTHKEAAMSGRYMVELDRGGADEPNVTVLKASIVVHAPDLAAAEQAAEGILRSLKCNGYVDSVYELA